MTTNKTKRTVMETIGHVPVDWLGCKKSNLLGQRHNFNTCKVKLVQENTDGEINFRRLSDSDKSSNYCELYTEPFVYLVRGKYPPSLNNDDEDESLNLDSNFAIKYQCDTGKHNSESNYLDFVVCLDSNGNFKTSIEPILAAAGEHSDILKYIKENSKLCVLISDDGGSKLENCAKEIDSSHISLSYISNVEINLREGSKMIKVPGIHSNNLKVHRYSKDSIGLDILSVTSSEQHKCEGYLPSYVILEK